MKIHGYCITCHRVKRVTVRGNELAIASAKGGVARGICDACQDEADRKRNAGRQLTLGDIRPPAP